MPGSSSMPRRALGPGILEGTSAPGPIWAMLSMDMGLYTAALLAWMATRGCKQLVSGATVTLWLCTFRSLISWFLQGLSLEGFSAGFARMFTALLLRAEGGGRGQG